MCKVVRGSYKVDRAYQRLQEANRALTRPLEDDQAYQMLEAVRGWTSLMEVKQGCRRLDEQIKNQTSLLEEG